MADLVPGFQGGQEFTPSGGGGMSPEQKLADMAKLLQGAPNSVLDMLARILRMPIGGEQAPQGPASNAVPMNPEQWQRMFPMPPVHGPAQFPGVDTGQPGLMTPTFPENRVNPPIGFVRG